MMFKKYCIVFFICTLVQARPVHKNRPSSRGISVFDDADTFVSENLEDLGEGTPSKDTNSSAGLPTKSQNGFPVFPGFNAPMTEAPRPEPVNKNPEVPLEQKPKPTSNGDVSGRPGLGRPGQANIPNREDDDNSYLDWETSDEESQEPDPVVDFLEDFGDIVEKGIRSVVKAGREFLSSQEYDEYSLL